jgi:PKD repeat protein
MMKDVRLNPNQTVMFTISNKISPLKLWAILFIVFSCGSDDEPVVPAVSNFSFAVDATDKGKVTFTNTSTDAVSVSWNFGDGSATSAETSPVHTYAESGTYEVALTATGKDSKTSVKKQNVEIALPSKSGAPEFLIGDGSKVWKISADAGSFKVGPGVDNGGWWTLPALSDRPCLANDRFIFSDDGTFEYKANGDVFGEAYMGVTPDGCVAESSLAGAKTAWGSGKHTFTYVAAAGTTPAKITVKGTGAFIALPKAYNGGEYNDTDNTGPDEDASVTYDILNTEGGKMKLSLHIAGEGYWTFVLEPAE